jgi:hypothetical protein
MRFTPSTIDAFRWCSRLNPALVLNPGQVLRTITSNKALILKVLIEEQLPTFCALNLAAFLRDLNTETDVHFDPENHIVLRNGRTTTKVPKIDPQLVMRPPSKELAVTDFQEKVFMHVDDLEQMPLVKRVSLAKHSRNQSEHTFEFYAAKEGAPISLDIIKDDVVRTIDLTISRSAKQPFLARIKQSNLVLLPGCYEVEFSKVGVSLLSGKWQTRRRLPKRNQLPNQGEPSRVPPTR